METSALIPSWPGTDDASSSGGESQPTNADIMAAMTVMQNAMVGMETRIMTGVSESVKAVCTRWRGGWWPLCGVQSVKNLNMRSWVEEARLRKWRWARNLYTEKSSEQWSTRALHWNPQIHYDRPKPAARRRPTRPNLRWLDDIVKVNCGTSGAAAAEDLRRLDFWTQYQDSYVKETSLK